MGLLGRLAGLGRALITRGLGGVGGNAPPVTVTPIVEVCVSLPVHPNASIVCKVSPVAVTLDVDPVVTARLPMHPDARATLTVPSC